jgi:hypothetical protein
MTIRSDLDDAIVAASRRGVGLAAMRIRMGPAALTALASTLELSERPIEGEIVAYEGIPIEGVEAPGPQGQGLATETRFHGWELVTGE